MTGIPETSQSGLPFATPLHRFGGALLVFRSSHQTLWDQVTNTKVAFDKK